MSSGRHQRPGSEDAKAGRKPISVRESSGYLVSDQADQHPPQPSRRLSADGHDWIARLAGEGAGGAGAMYALRFFRADKPDTPVRELLTGSLDLDALHPDEVRRLYARATVLTSAD